MQSRISADAPGKLILSGEYAVLGHAPAIAAAVDRRVHVTLQPANTAHCSLRSNTADAVRDFDFDAAGSIVWHAAPGAAGDLPAAAQRVFAAAGMPLAELAPFSIEIDSRAFYRDDTAKLGLGSSAAVAVALTTALLAAFGRAPDLKLCLAVHREFQQGRGSGLDVQTSFHGGVIERDAAGRVAALALPAGLAILPVSTGLSASTPELLARLEAFKAAEPAQFQACMHALESTAQDVATAWHAGALPGLLNAFSAFAAALEGLDAAGAIGIWSPEHRRLQALARAAGVIYKPSGAGGGDLGIALTDDDTALERFGQSVATAGFSMPKLGPGAPGVACRTTR